MSKLKRIRKLVRHYGPNSSTALGIVSLGEREPFKAYQPMRFTQLIGGKRWSLSVTWMRDDAQLVSNTPPSKYLKEGDPRQT